MSSSIHFASFIRLKLLTPSCIRISSIELTRHDCICMRIIRRYNIDVVISSYNVCW
ncbi:unnamed protein product [Schistosoma mattheei]|uniref:Uncharacterized protein n=1 Tax=Schistosoma mattheei TaxID=31246 RepID=A0A183PT69_9TREM|nr:unnamed protein product [Schistosoma mattheei]